MLAISVVHGKVGCCAASLWCMMIMVLNSDSWRVVSLAFERVALYLSIFMVMRRVMSKLQGEKESR